MPNTHATLTALFADIADAIRAKTGGTEPIRADAFPDAIAAITGGIPLLTPAAAFPYSALLTQGFGWSAAAEEAEE